MKYLYSLDMVAADPDYERMWDFDYILSSFIRDWLVNDDDDSDRKADAQWQKSTKNNDEAKAPTPQIIILSLSS